MGKRSQFERVERDFYPTPSEAVLPLLPHLRYGASYCEPCAGDGALVRALHPHAVCELAVDIEPRADWIIKADALVDDLGCIPEMFITNSPWNRAVLHPLIVRLSDIAPTWLLIDADWVHTRQSIPFLPRLKRIVSVGRVKWIPDSKMTGKDNCAWHLFDTMPGQGCQFFGRTHTTSRAAKDPEH